VPSGSKLLMITDWVGMGSPAALETGWQSRRTPKVLGGLLRRGSTKPPTPLRNAEWGTLRGDLCAGQEVKFEERSLVGPTTGPRDDTETEADSFAQAAEIRCDELGRPLTSIF
jgi:hypothetical protein